MVGKSLFWKRLVPLIFAVGVFTGAASAETVVHVAPPRPPLQKRTPPPAKDDVWIDGYQKWDGKHFSWVPGKWEKPPQPNLRWQPFRWVKRSDGWVLEEG